MSAARARTTAKGSASSAARKAATGAAKKAATSAARTAGRSAAKGAAKAGTRAAVAGGERIGRGTRWTEDQVALLLDTVKGSATAKEAFETVAKQLGKSAGTVQQKYYNLQKQNGAGATPRRRGRPAGSTNRPARATGGATSRATAGGVPTAAGLRDLSVDDLVRLTQLVKDEVARRSAELDRAKALLPA